MSAYTQANRALQITTPLGADTLLIVGLEGREALSELFHFDLDLLAENGQNIEFDKVVGQKAVVSLALGGGKFRYFAGIVSQLSQGMRDSDLTRYRAELVPQFWLLTHRRQSRIFQHLSIPDILKKVLAGLDVTFEIAGTFYPRDYCVQYQESDFAFASRLMEEEGIYYFFKHDANGHTMVVANSPESHPSLSTGPLVFEENTNETRSPGGITEWEKVQQLRPRTYTLWDHCFELPKQNLVATRAIADSAAVGKVTHKLRLPANDKLEIYEYPGAYAQRFDGISSGGADQPADLKKIFEDNERTVKIRMEQEAVPGLYVRGAGYCRQLVVGYKFTLSQHFSADGGYVLTNVQHSAHYADDYRSGETAPFEYQNRFMCIPADLPYRPPQMTPKPAIAGMQTALVVGPPGEVIFCDKYGRVKVQFFWDRQGKKNADSSCWIRVGQTAAGQGFGAITLPRIGWEVIVAFLEGDPDQPIIVGNVYNAENMPPYKLPDLRTISGAVHRSHHGVAKNANEIRFQDQLGSELFLLHAETDSIQQAENNHLMQVGNVHRHEVGKFYHKIVGQPVDVNKAALAAPAGVAGSGAGGGRPVEMPDEDRTQVANPVSFTTGSGAGGGDPPPPKPSDAKPVDEHDDGSLVQVWGPNTSDTYGDNTTYITGNDTYHCEGAASTTVDMNNTTVTGGDDTFTCKGTGRETYLHDFYSSVDGDNYTTIKWVDHYEAQDSHSTVNGRAFVYEGCEFNFIPLLIEGRVLHLEANAMTHIELKLISYENAVIQKEGSPIKIISLG